MKIIESRLRTIIYEEVAHRIIDQIIEEELNKFLSENKEYEAIKAADANNIKRMVKRGLLTMAIAAPLLGVLQNKTSKRADVAAAKRTAAEQSVEIQKELSSYALEDTESLLRATAQYMWSLDSAADKQSVGGEEGEDFQDTVAKKQNFPIFQDYMGGRTQMLSGERGVVQKVFNDINNQIVKGVIYKSDLQPGITDVRSADVSAEDYVNTYKDRYNLPDFNPAKVGKEDIGGNQDKMQQAAQQIHPKGFDFLKKGGESFGYETYELLDAINPELPNSKLSPSQYYMQIWNKVTGQGTK